MSPPEVNNEVQSSTLLSGDSELYVSRHPGAGPVCLALTPILQHQGAFYPLTEANWSLPNRAVEPQLQEEERMVYVAFSEFFFDSAMESYFRAGALKLSLVGDKVSRDLFVRWGPVMGLLPYPRFPCAGAS